MVKCICITGPESSGKTTLAKELAAQLNGVVVPVYSRVFLEQQGPYYTFEHLELMARGQADIENRALRNGPFPVILDTSLEVHNIWSNVKFGKVSPWIEKQWHKRPIDGYILCRPDLNWEEDPLRENPFDRDSLFDQYNSHLSRHNKRFAVAEGHGPDRLAMALQAVNAWT